MKHLVFFMGIFNLLLAFQNNLCHIISSSTSTPKISPTIMSLFLGLGMISVMKTKVPLTKTTILECSPHQYFAFKNYQIFEKTLHPLSNT
jgi:hypothetical protein